MNDECIRGDYIEAHGPTRHGHSLYVIVPITPEKRFERMKKWIEDNLKPVEVDG
jgi:hypothetical protein